MPPPESEKELPTAKSIEESGKGDGEEKTG